MDEALACGGTFPGGLPVPLSDLKRRRRTPPPPPNNLTEGSNDSVESVSNSAGLSGEHNWLLSPAGSGVLDWFITYFHMVFGNLLSILF